MDSVVSTGAHGGVFPVLQSKLQPKCNADLNVNSILVKKKSRGKTGRPPLLFFAAQVKS